MGKLDDYSLDQVAGALALIISSVGGLLLICFKSRCSQIKLCWGLWSCIRVIPNEDSDDETPQTPRTPRLNQPEPETVIP
tara:strand:+ start:175 stop:414 length:240 start_codon:yes stop_codon:yes gene_type:complete